MASFMDVHPGFVGVTAEQVKEAHHRVVAIERDEGVHVERAWLFRSRRPIAALPLTFLIATLFGIAPLFAATPPSVTPIESVNLQVTGDLAPGASSGGFSSVPGMFDPDPSARSAPTVGDLSVTGLPADLGKPSGGFSSAPGMSPDTTTTPSVARPTRRGGVTGSLPIESVNVQVTGDLAPGASSGGFSSVPGMFDPDPGARSGRTVGDLSVTGLPADLGKPSGGFSSAPGMSPETSVPPAGSTRP